MPSPDTVVPPPHPDFLRAEAFREGLRDMAPMAPGIGAWALATGVAMVQSELSITQALVMSGLAYAGSAQLAVLPLIATDSPVWLIFFTAVMVNLRFVIYAATLRKPLAHLPWQRRLYLGYLTGDLTFVVLMRRLQRMPDWPARDSYMLGLGIANWVIWHAGCFAGILLAAWVPHDWGLGLAGTLVLLALLIPSCRQPAAALGVTVSAVVAVLAHGWPLRTGLLAAIACGVFAALAFERFGKDRFVAGAP